MNIKALIQGLVATHVLYVETIPQCGMSQPELHNYARMDSSTGLLHSV